MPALGGLPRKTSLRTWSAPIPPTGILISSHVSCKPLTLLQNLVNSDVRTSASFQLNCSVTFSLTTQQEPGRGHTVGKLFWAEPDEQCLLQRASQKFWMTWNQMLIWHSYALLYCRKMQRTVFSDPVWPGPDRNQSVPQSAGLQRPVPVQWTKDELYRDDFLFFPFIFFYLFCWLSLTPSEDQRHGAFVCCQSCSKVKWPSVHLKQTIWVW